MRKLELILGALLLFAIAIVGISIGVRALFDHLQSNRVEAVIAPAAYDRLKFVTKLYHASVLMYFPQRDGGEKMACTATAIQEVPDNRTNRKAGYLFISASHCVDGKRIVDLARDEFPDGGKKVYYHAVVVAQSDRSLGVDASVLFVATQDNFETIPIGHNPSQLGETIFNLSGPEGSPKQIFPGYISSLYLNRPAVLSDGSNWEGYLLVAIPGAGSPGASGSMLVCENQQAICGLFVGLMPGGMVALPINRYTSWWEGIKTGKIKPFPASAPEKTEPPMKSPIGKPIV